MICNLAFGNLLTMLLSLMVNQEMGSRRSVIQSDLTSVDVWASNNLAKLDAKKCKEMQICFFWNKSDRLNLRVGDQVLECVSPRRVLGLIIQDILGGTNILR